LALFSPMWADPTASALLRRASIDLPVRAVSAALAF
jgi:hypothetical protein